MQSGQLRQNTPKPRKKRKRGCCAYKLEFEREFALAMGPKIISDSVGGVVLGAPQRTNGLMTISLDTQCFSFSTDS